MLNLAPSRHRNMISLTPLIDVVFILLLFFMLSSTFTRWHQLTLAMPVSSQQQTTDLTVVKIKSNLGQVLVNNQDVDIYNTQDLQLLVQSLAESKLVIIASKSITIQTIVTVMDSFKQAGVTKVSFAGVEQ